MSSATPLLAIDGLQAWYGESQVLHGVSFEVAAGEAVTLLGRNGSGKTTTLQVDHGHRSSARRIGPLRWDGVDRSEQRSDCALRVRILPGGTRHLMLAIGRILRTSARLLLLDEPTEGLAPVIIQQIGNTIRALKQQGFTILLVEQNFRFASTIADRYYVMEDGLIVDSFRNSELMSNLGKVHQYLGV